MTTSLSDHCLVTHSNQPSNMVIITANGTKVRALGVLCRNF
ncbi:7156_t:CDS:2 [Rhizophagus irregularis]|nr:7156_t:CDS:2 [Rhizophagus irregularis]